MPVKALLKDFERPLKGRPLDTEVALSSAVLAKRIVRDILATKKVPSATATPPDEISPVAASLGSGSVT